MLVVLGCWLLQGGLDMPGLVSTGRRAASEARSGSRLCGCFDSSLGYPGEGPIRVDEGSGGVMQGLGGSDAGSPATPLATPAPPPRRGPRVKPSDRKWRILTANTTAWFRADLLLDSRIAAGSVPDMVCMQEIGRLAGQVEDLKSSLAARRWQAAVAPSVRTTDGGTSAGAAVLGRWAAAAVELDTPDVGKR